MYKTMCTLRRGMGECRCTSTNSYSRHQIEGSGQHRSPAVFPCGKSPHFSLNGKLGGTQTLSKLGGTQTLYKRAIQQENLFVLPEVDPRFLNRPTCTLFTIPTTQSFKIYRVIFVSPLFPFDLKTLTIVYVRPQMRSNRSNENRKHRKDVRSYQ